VLESIEEKTMAFDRKNQEKTTLWIPLLLNQGELRYDYENPYEKQATRHIVVMMKTHPWMHVKPWGSFLPTFIATSG